MKTQIPVIDLFAGPGGLSEGFASASDYELEFRINLSIEKDFWAHKTLLLRSFFREFDQPPKSYYDYLQGSIISQNQLFEKHKKEHNNALKKAWNAELGVVNEKDVDKKIHEALDGAKTWVLLGGPPCQAYSTAGRSRMKSNKKSFEKDERHYLYRHYLRIIAKHKPTIFVMENVKGLLSSKIKGNYIFNEILRDLREPFNGNDCANPKYNIYPIVNYDDYDNFSFIESDSKASNFLIQCEKHGIPQTRHRIIIIGVLREISNLGNQYLKEEKKQVHTHDVLDDITPIRSKLSKNKDTLSNWKTAICQEYVNYIYSNNGLSKKIKYAIDDALTDIQIRKLNSGSNFVKGVPNPKMLKNWYVDHNLKGFCNHESRGHISLDLLRYLFVSCYGKINNVSPTLNHFPESLLPLHKNVSKSLETKHSYFADRFRVQIANKPSTTITSHIHKDGHFYIHYDPSQCRSLTVREAARLQTFPDNYYFEGSRTQQYKQVGNAVPPLLAYKIANIIKNIIKNNN
jgi:DNA (cytosine-5)-methyltransferase 1